MTRLQNLLNFVWYPSKEKIDLITHAYHYAKHAHAGQKRYSGEPYFNHVVETAKILAELGMGRRTICAGLLHDILEDAHISSFQLEKEFGKQITFLVKGVTKLGAIRYTNEKRHIESLRKLFVATSHDIRVLIIKLADRLHNMRTLQHVPKEKQERIARETMEIYIPIAYRLGMRKLKREMEDLAFKYIEPEKYKEIQKAVKKRKLKKEEQLDKFKHTLIKALVKEKIPHVKTDTRIKSLYSIYRKMEEKQRTNIDKIYDIHALRVHVDTISDCYRVLGIIHGIWRPLPGRIKDYIAFPKPNGYQSLHTVVFTGDGLMLEVQIRTHDMHKNAEFGIAGHLSYKSKDEELEDPNFSWFKQFFPQPPKNFKLDRLKFPHVPQWITELVDVQSYVTMPTEFMHNLKSDFFQQRMFIFDPQGDVIDLPVGSSVIDYTYSMDAKRGNKLSGAKVNNKKVVSLETILKNGDIVEIETHKTAHPTIKWLSHCKTAKAKKGIRQYIHARKKITKN
jgi:guanosine-3',5'-bis(diphosphate) 3'-pyrophosphohydrolase